MTKVVDDLLEEFRRKHEMIAEVQKNAATEVKGVWAYLVQDKAAGETVATALVGPHRIPLVATCPDRLKALAPYAEQVARTTGATVRLAYFGTREDVASVSPAGRS